MIELVLKEYGLPKGFTQIAQYGSGLINNTWLVSTNDEKYILQKVNTSIFKEPANISNNISYISRYLNKNHPGYLFAAPIVAKNGKEMIFIEGSGYFRLFPFVNGSSSSVVVQTPEIAFEAAAQFGRFTKLLSEIDLDNLKFTIPDFHDLNKHYQQFLSSLSAKNENRQHEAKDQIKMLKENYFIVKEYTEIQSNTEFKKRVTHHDTKISNVLFDNQGKGLCVIDLDTIMPGYFISDVGDMMRTYLSPVSEEETDFSKIIIRKEYYKAIVEGYLSEMKDVLTETEKSHFIFAGKFGIYMQAVRFMTDYLNNDTYYSTTYQGQNLVRASNQIVLLQKLLEMESELKIIGRSD